MDMVEEGGVERRTAGIDYESIENKSAGCRSVLIRCVFCVRAYDRHPSEPPPRCVTPWMRLAHLDIGARSTHYRREGERAAAAARATTT